MWRMVSMQQVPWTQSLGPGSVSKELRVICTGFGGGRPSCGCCRSGRGRSAFGRHRSAIGQLASAPAAEAGSLACLLPRLSHRSHVEVADLPGRAGARRATLAWPGVPRHDVAVRAACVRKARKQLLVRAAHRPLGWWLRSFLVFLSADRSGGVLHHAANELVLGFDESVGHIHRGVDDLASPGRTFAVWQRRQRFVNDVEELADRLDRGPRPGLERLEHFVGELGRPVDLLLRSCSCSSCSRSSSRALCAAAPLRAASLRWAVVSGMGIASFEGTCPHGHAVTEAGRLGLPARGTRFAATVVTDPRQPHTPCHPEIERRVIGRKQGRGRTLEASYRSSGSDGIQASSCPGIPRRCARQRRGWSAPRLAGSRRLS